MRVDGTPSTTQEGADAVFWEEMGGSEAGLPSSLLTLKKAGTHPPFPPLPPPRAPLLPRPPML